MVAREIFAGEHGMHLVPDHGLREIYEAYFVDHWNIGDIEVLLDAVRKCDLRVEGAREVLESCSFHDAVDRDWAQRADSHIIILVSEASASPFDNSLFVDVFCDEANERQLRHGVCKVPIHMHLNPLSADRRLEPMPRKGGRNANTMPYRLLAATELAEFLRAFVHPRRIQIVEELRV